MPYGASITKRKQSLLKFSVKELTENETLLQKHRVSYQCFHVCPPLETFLRKYYVSSQCFHVCPRRKILLQKHYISYVSQRNTKFQIFTNNLYKIYEFRPSIHVNYIIFSCTTYLYCPKKPQRPLPNLQAQYGGHREVVLHRQ